VVRGESDAVLSVLGKYDRWWFDPPFDYSPRYISSGLITHPEPGFSDVPGWQRSWYKLFQMMKDHYVKVSRTRWDSLWELFYTYPSICNGRKVSITSSGPKVRISLITEEERRILEVVDDMLNT